ncbi:MAG: YdeI/OmpD-associated family protein [Candidatus Nomurabacteria bacterium]|nr:YdeI/OmpD-associated family protein [Candidatus Saccharibacteria bacterium]USN95567.1 MAG: YdeI/OmpD-associated family protein [Candidatus Nomurabacteria bacterium]
MPKIQLSPGTAHQIPPDLTKALKANIEVSKIWNNLTPIQRNEWICWVISVKKESTRKEHITRVIKQLQEGKRRPCCWIGCVHRTDKAISPSVKSILEKRSKPQQI